MKCKISILKKNKIIFGVTYRFLDRLIFSVKFDDFILIKKFVYLKIPSIFAPAKEKINDLVAQLVEHLPFKERVLGSSPSPVTKSFS